MAMSQDQLQQYRKEIDSLDRKLLALLNQRIRVSINIGAVKLASGRKVFAPDREEEVLRRLEDMNDGPLDGDTLRSIYREIINGSIAVQARLAIGYLGRRGSQIAMVATNRFGHSHDYRGFDSFPKFWKALSDGKIEVGVVERSRLITYGLQNGSLPWPVCSDLGMRKENGEKGMDRQYFLISRTESYACSLGRTVVWLETDNAEMCVKSVKSLLQIEKLQLLRSESIRLARPAKSLCVQLELEGDVPGERLRKLIRKLPRDLVIRWCRVGCFP